MTELLKYYSKRKKEIKQRLRDFKDTYKKSDNDIFAELCFCILTPQAKAVVCDEAINRLKRQGFLFGGTQRNIRSCLKGVRFPNNKARYIIAARDFLKNGKGVNIKNKLDTKDLFKTRDWLVKNIKGLGYKEASHFLRNIGFGKDMAILDVHIIRNLKRYSVVRRFPASLTRKSYRSIEERMREFSKKTRIPLDELDLLFWSKETGRVFK